MQADERQLITDLFERMRSFGPVEKDRDAEALIVQQARQNPDAGYMLVQSVLVQEQALAQQQARIEELEAQVRQLQQTQSRAAPQPAQSSGGGSFLGGLFGGNRSANVPASGRSAPAPAASPWGNANARPMAAQPMAQGAPAQGGGFMRSAMATAAGVAGGMLAANAISGMMRGNSGENQTASNQPAPQAEPEQSQAYDDTNNDPGNYTEPAADTGGGWDGGGDIEL